MKHILRVLFLVILGVIGANPAQVHPLSLTCPSGGTKQLSTASVPVSWINFQTPSDNAGAIYIGDSSVTGTSASCNASGSKGTCLTASGTSFLPPLANVSAYNLSNIYFVCTTNTDSLIGTYLQ